MLAEKRRLAGVVQAVAGLTINGGLGAREIGILAPGVQSSLWWVDEDEISAGDQDLPALAWESKEVAKNAYGNALNGLFLNYDFRVRNGGVSLDLLSAREGDFALGDRMIFVRESGRTPYTVAEVEGAEPVGETSEADEKVVEPQPEETPSVDPAKVD
jgi:hypothetical protein